MSDRLVIIGGGQAAAQAIQTARQGGFDGPITLIGDETTPPYQRPPLSKKYLASEISRDRLILKPESFYQDRDVELLLGRRAVELDSNKLRVRLDDSADLSFDFLLLAMGSRPRRIDVPRADLSGIHYLRSIADVDSIVEDLRPTRRIAIIGGGYIGLEVAAVCLKLGHIVTIVEATDRILKRVVGTDTADFFTNLHRDAGVDIVLDSLVVEFEGKTRVTGLRTQTGRRVDCDCVIVGVGIEPNIELAKEAGLHCDNGVVVDPFSRTMHDRIFAAGDCTSHSHPLVGRRVRLESVQNAIEQGKAAARSLIGAPQAFDEVPWFWSDQYDIKLQIAGLATDYDETVVRGDPVSRSFAVYYLGGGQLIAVDAINRPREFLTGKKLISARARLPASAIANEKIDLVEAAATT